MSKQKSKKKKKAKKSLPAIPTLRFTEKTQFDVCQEALRDAKVAKALLSFYSPLTGDLVAHASATDSGEMGVATVEDYGLTLGTMKELVKWMEGLQKPAAITLGRDICTITEGE